MARADVFTRKPRQAKLGEPGRMRAPKSRTRSEFPRSEKPRGDGALETESYIAGRSRRG